MRRKLTTLIFGLAVAASLTACVDGEPSAAQQEGQSKQDSYGRMVAAQPAETMDYSPTRETINGWVKTWEQPGKLSYVYMQNGEGKLIGYYILKGLPVNYNAMLTPSYELIDTPNDGSNALNMQVQAPAQDGVYYGGSGGGASTYYGFDAVSGSYMEYTVGLGINILLFDKPMPNAQNVMPLGDATVEAVN